MSKLGALFFGNNKVGKDLKLLLFIGLLYALSVALSNTFVNVYLWKQKSDYMTIALYNLSIVITQPIIFMLAGKWAKQVDRVIVLRMGVFSLSVFFSVVLLLGDLAADWVIFLGVLIGIGFGFYWLAFNVLTFEITNPQNRDLFNGFMGLMGSLAGMIGPFFAGWLITRMKEMTGYTVIFAVSLGLFITAVILSFFLKRRSAEGKFRLKYVLRWKKISKNWKRILLSNFFQGLREGSFAFLIGIWIFVAAGTELALGTFAMITSAVSFIIFYIVGRFISKKRRRASMLAGALLLSASVWIIAFHLSMPTLMTYGVVISIAYPFLMVPFSSLSFDVIGKEKKAAEWRIEYIVGRELFLNAGRLLSIGLFMTTIWLFDIEKALTYFILIIGQVQLIIYLYVRRIKL